MSFHSIGGYDHSRAGSGRGDEVFTVVPEQSIRPVAQRLGYFREERSRAQTFEINAGNDSRARWHIHGEFGIDERFRSMTAGGCCQQQEQSELHPFMIAGAGWWSWSSFGSVL